MGSEYIDVWRNHMLTFWDIHECDHFMNDSSVAHKSKAVKKFLYDNSISVLKWPGNSSDLHPRENA